MAAAKNVGQALGFRVHWEDSGTEMPDNGKIVRNLSLGSNLLQSHILHLYHLAALDYVDPNLIGVNKPPFCPTYDASNFRFDPATTAYLVEQYVDAMRVRRMCHQIGAIWMGKQPIAHNFTPGGASSSVTVEKIAKYKELLYKGKPGDQGYPGTPGVPAAGTIMAFIGHPADFALTNTGTMFYDTVAVAITYPEYFWIGNSWHNFLAYGNYEFASDFMAGNSNPDHRLNRRGRRLDADPTNMYTGYTTGTVPGGGLLPDKSLLLAPLPVSPSDIFEFVRSSWYYYASQGKGGKLQPSQGETTQWPDKPKAYSWIKSPRYYDPTNHPLGLKYMPYEVGPLSRMVVNGDYYAGYLYDAGYVAAPKYGAAYPGASPPGLMGTPYIGDSVLDRIAARTLETFLVAHAVAQWLDNLTPGAETSTSRAITQERVLSYGMTEAPRGALAHWMKMKDGKVKRYQCVVPTTWNGNPRDGRLDNPAYGAGTQGQPGPAEKSLENLYLHDYQDPIEINRVIHSYDFCAACAIHLITPKGVKKIAIDPTL